MLMIIFLLYIKNSYKKNLKILSFGIKNKNSNIKLISIKKLVKNLKQY